MSEEKLVFVGTYTEPIRFGTGEVLQGQGEGIYVYRLNVDSGELSLIDVHDAGPNPSYMAFDSSRRMLYAVNELKEFEGEKSGAVSAFAVDPENGNLTFLNRKPTHGTDPCHLIVDKTGRYVMVANFMSGSVCVLGIQEDGSLGDSTDFIQHEGSSVDPNRQVGPHAHAVTLDGSGQYAFVPDLGMDKLMVYRIDLENGKLLPADQPWVKTADGAGPRQVVMHPNGKYAYLINELNSTMTAFEYDGNGGLREIQTVSTLPEGFTGRSSCAEVQITPSGKYLFGSNRGHDSIVVYAVNQDDGTLTTLGFQDAKGKTPRNFVVGDDGETIIIVNQDSDNMVTFKLDPSTGEIAESGFNYKVGTPVCVKIM